MNDFMFLERTSNTTDTKIDWMMSNKLFSLKILIFIFVVLVLLLHFSIIELYNKKNSRTAHQTIVMTCIMYSNMMWCNSIYHYHVSNTWQIWNEWENSVESICFENENKMNVKKRVKTTKKNIDNDIYYIYEYWKWTIELE